MIQTDPIEEAGREDAAWFDKLLLKMLSQTAFDILAAQFARVRHAARADAFNEVANHATARGNECMSWHDWSEWASKKVIDESIKGLPNTSGRSVAVARLIEDLKQTDIMDWPKHSIESQDMTAQLRKRKWEKVQASLAALIAEEAKP